MLKLDLKKILLDFNDMKQVETLNSTLLQSFTCLNYIQQTVVNHVWKG